MWLFGHAKIGNGKYCYHLQTLDVVMWKTFCSIGTQNIFNTSSRSCCTGLPQKKIYLGIYYSATK